MPYLEIVMLGWLVFLTWRTSRLHRRLDDIYRRNQHV